MLDNLVDPNFTCGCTVCDICYIYNLLSTIQYVISCVVTYAKKSACMSIFDRVCLSELNNTVVIEKCQLKTPLWWQLWDAVMACTLPITPPDQFNLRQVAQLEALIRAVLPG